MNKVNVMEGSPMYPRTPPELSPGMKTPSPMSASSSSRSSRREGKSPEPNCAICLEKLQKPSVTDSCLHKFCFTCLLEWSKVKAECPLCKSKFASIIHNIKSDADYEKYTLPLPSSPHEAPPGLMSDEQRLREALLGINRSRFLNLPTYSGQAIQGAVPMWRRRRDPTSEFRREVYEGNLWVNPGSLVDITSRYRECSPEWYRNNPAQTHRLVPWLNRELYVLLNRDSERVQDVLNSVLELICNHDILSRDFHDALVLQLGARTSHFCHEFYYYARSVYDLVGYDRNAHYIQRRPIVNSESTTDSDDVVVVDEVRTARSLVDSNFHPIDINSVFDFATRDYMNENTPTTSGGEASSMAPQVIVPVDSSDGVEDDNVEIVDVVRPRTPEVVCLSTDDNDEEGRAACRSSAAVNLGDTIVISSDEEHEASSSRPRGRSIDSEDRSLRRKKKCHYRVSSPSSTSSSSLAVTSPSSKRHRRQNRKNKKHGKKRKVPSVLGVDESENTDSQNDDEEQCGEGAPRHSKRKRRKARKKKKGIQEIAH